jgi:AbrB family looped-hinge helix DNA binding protein
MVFFTWQVIKFCEAVAMKKTKISSKGQITLPISVRRKLNITTGDVLYVKESSEGSVVLEAEMQIKENRSSIAEAITASSGIWKDKAPVDEQAIRKMRGSDLERLDDL